MTKEEVLEAAKHCANSGICSRCPFKNVNSCVRDLASFIVDNYDRVEPKPETVNHPFHYQGKHECIDEMIALFGVDAVKAFCRCNVYKYRYRADKKNGPEDIAKAEWYMDKLMELEGENA